VVLEAMALGLPVVAAAVGGIPEIVRDEETGVLIRNRDEALSSILRLLVDVPHLRQRLGQAARRLVREHLEMERMVDLTESILLTTARREDK